jgi:hypothetical protein
MWVVVFAANPAPYLSIVIGICGLGGLVFTALRYRRDDTTAVVGQQDVVLNDMKMVNEELRTTAVLMKQQRDDCQQEVQGLRNELREARDHLSGQMTEIQDKLDDDG